jgi:hypothetical protein
MTTRFLHLNSLIAGPTLCCVVRFPCSLFSEERIARASGETEVVVELCFGGVFLYVVGGVDLGMGVAVWSFVGWFWVIMVRWLGCGVWLVCLSSLGVGIAGRVLRCR